VTRQGGTRAIPPTQARISPRTSSRKETQRRNRANPSERIARFGCVPSMFDSLGVEVPYPT